MHRHQLHNTSDGGRVDTSTAVRARTNYVGCLKRSK